MTTKLKDYEEMISFIEATRNEVIEFFSNEDKFTRNNLISYLLVDLHKELDHPLVCVARQTALASITAIRTYYNSLVTAKKLFEENEHDYTSSISSCKRMMKMTEKAFEELQKVTGDKTPLEMKKE